MTNASVRRNISRGTGFAAGLLLAQACWVYSDTEEHCANQDGDAYCRRVYGAGGAQFCAVGACAEAALDGCVEARPATNACYAACGGGKSVEDDPECEGVAEGSSSSQTETSVDATTEPTGGPTTMGSMSASGSETESVGTSSTGGVGCEDSSECTDPLAPICGVTMCVPCLTDDECLAKGPGAPVCAEDGRCVACTPSNIGACEGTTPVCDGAANECVGCGFHEECPGTACDIATGACFEDDCVVEVDGDGGADYEDIQDAIGDGCVVIVHELNGGDTYSQFSATAIHVAVLAADGEEPRVAGLAGNPSMTVTTGAVAYVQGLTFSGNTMAEGVSVNGANLYLDRTEIVANSGGGIALANNAVARLRNCTLGGSAMADVAAAAVDGASLDALYTTMVGYDDGGGGGAALRCSNPVSVVVRNSILVKTFGTPEIECGGASITYSGTEALVVGAGNVQLGNMVPSWFDSDLHLNMPPGAVLTTAQWQPGHPSVDIDGDARPDEPGATDVAGADVP